jgi:uridylate kinase
VMDAAALSLCRENNVPILVFNILEDGAIERAVEGKQVGTLVTAGETRFSDR